MKLDRNTIAVGLMSLNLLFATLPIQAQNSKQGSKCNATLQSVKNKITKGRKVSIVKVSKDNIAQDYQSYPKNRPFGYYFVLSGADTDSVLSSSQLLTPLSRDIITNCSNVSQVTYGLETSGYFWLNARKQN
jgi:hypothetical protein